MPSRPPRVCPRCRGVHAAGDPCPHAPVGGPNRNRRTPLKRLYKTPEWQALRAAVLRDEPHCRICGAPAEVVDHIAPHRGDWRLFTDRANLRALCRSCHNRKTASRDGGFGNRTRGDGRNFGQGGGDRVGGYGARSGRNWECAK